MSNQEVYRNIAQLENYEYLIMVSNKINFLCSFKCGVSKIEDKILFSSKDKDTQMAINESINCYDRCLSKNFSSSLLALSIMQDIHLSK